MLILFALIDQDIQIHGSAQQTGQLPTFILIYLCIAICIDKSFIS